MIILNHITYWAAAVAGWSAFILLYMCKEMEAVPMDLYASDVCLSVLGIEARLPFFK